MTQYYRYAKAGTMLTAVRKFVNSHGYRTGQTEIIIGYDVETRMRLAPKKPFWFYIESKCGFGAPS